MGLSEIQCDSLLKNKYNEVGIPQFYYYYLPSHCSEMRQFAVRILAMLGSVYLCGHLFSFMKANKSAQKSKTDSRTFILHIKNCIFTKSKA
jgi:hypothetical protein